MLLSVFCNSFCIFSGRIRLSPIGKPLLFFEKFLLIPTGIFLFFAVSSLFILEFALFLKHINNDLKKYKCNSEKVKCKNGLLRHIRAKADGGQI